MKDGKAAQFLLCISLFALFTWLCLLKEDLMAFITVMIIIFTALTALTASIAYELGCESAKRKYDPNV